MDLEFEGAPVTDVIDELDVDPLRQLQAWLEEASQSTLQEPSAMALATVGADGAPQVRMVLLRGVETRGLTFFTNYESAKGKAIDHEPRVAVVLYWDPLGRQVRVTGRAERVGREESAAYFASRAPGSRIAAWASDQSREIADRAALEARFEGARRRHPDGDVPPPPTWGGFRLRPTAYEFWIGRPDRLHDRIRYTISGDGWRRERLMP